MIRLLIVGVGRMGFAHAKACATLNEFEIVGLVARDFSKWKEVTEHFPDIPLYNDFKQALSFTKPDAVCISSYTDTHAAYSIAAMEAGADVFVEKPLALNSADANKIIETARHTGRKLIVGYILRHHAVWKKFVELANALGHPLAVKMTTNQHSTGAEWEIHKSILNAGLSPLVDAGIHYVDVMNQLTSAKISHIKAVGKKTMAGMVIENETNMTLSYSDGSTLYFESGFGPNIDPDDIPVKRAHGPKGFVEITTENRVIHNGVEYPFSEEEQGKTILNQQKHFLKVIKEDIDLEDHWHAATSSLNTVFEAEEIMKNS